MVPRDGNLPICGSLSPLKPHFQEWRHETHRCRSRMPSCTRSLHHREVRWLWEAIESDRPVYDCRPPRGLLLSHLPGQRLFRRSPGREKARHAREMYVLWWKPERHSLPVPSDNCKNAELRFAPASRPSTTGPGRFATIGSSRQRRRKSPRRTRSAGSKMRSRHPRSGFPPTRE